MYNCQGMDHRPPRVIFFMGRPRGVRRALVVVLNSVEDDLYTMGESW
jgi:hypothetical protein